MAANINTNIHMSTKIDPRLFHQAEQGNTHARDKLRSLASTGWVSDKVWTPIQFAAANGLVKVVEILAREREQDIHARLDEDWTLLHWAAFNGHLEVASLLV